MADATAISPQGDHIPVLLYHSVSDAAAHTAIADYTTGVDEFARHVAAIAATGREAVTFGELTRRMAGGERSRLRDVVCVTFDDGWADNLAAAGVLTAAGLPATFFITSGLIGRPGMLDVDQLRDLAKLPGVEIGAHSVTHPHLDELGDETLAAEVRESRQWLRGALGTDVESFAYPHGAYGKRVRRAVADAGYSAAAAVKNALSHPDDDVYAVARWTVLSTHDADDVSDVLRGSLGARAWTGERVRTKAFRAVRRARRLAGRGEPSFGEQLGVEVGR